MQKMNKKQGGFTLLELLVVVGIMAIIGGAMISSFGGQEQKAARGAATATIAGVEDAFRIYQSTTSNLPNNLEALACLPIANAADPSAATIVNGPPATPAIATEAYKFGGISNASGIGGGMVKNLADKFDLVAIPAAGIQAMADMGLVNVRYAATLGCDNDVDVATGTTATDADGNTIDAGRGLVDISIPNHAFEDFRPGLERNRGRGFSATLTANSPLMLWGEGDQYNNKKVGGQAGSVLIGLGLGQSSSIIGTGGDAAFAKAPFYGQVGKDKYAHYVALIEIGVDGDADNDQDIFTTGGVADLTMGGVAFGNVNVIAVVDARGDFLDEEMAEFTGQKK